jgi:hypothetical protein
MRIFELLFRNDDTTKGNCTHAKPDFGPTPFSAALASALKQDGRVDHFRNSKWKRTFLSKTRYMGGRQCSKRLWQTVYDPEPEEEPLPGTVMGMGIEVGIEARLLWPGGVLVDTKYDQAEAIRLTKGLIADPTVRTIFEAALVRRCAHSS